MRAVTRLLSELDGGPAGVDLNDVARGDGMLFVQSRIGVAGRGVAARGDRTSIESILAGIDHDTTVPEVSPLAIGVLGFEPRDTGELVVPEVAVRRLPDDRVAVTTIDGTDWRPALAAPPDAATSVGAFTVAPEAVERYLAAVTAARDAVRAGDLTKAVIARPIHVASDAPIDVHAVLRRLRAAFGSSYRYSFDGLVGASPELLVEVERSNEEDPVTVVRSHPLAGTAPRTGDPERDAVIAAELTDSTKNQVEHRVVIDVVHDTLLPYASYLDWEPEPSIVTVANVQHLGTRMEGVLSDPAPSVLPLARALAPTPALGGHPRDEAIDLITAHEGFTRSRYGGAVGWVDAAGNGTWAVTIRCAEFSPDRCSARLVAGGGIVADSEPDAELAETQAKFQAMLGAIIRP
ncbi:MAG: isochorismate synthase [Actinomycetota bacterium]